MRARRPRVIPASVRVETVMVEARTGEPYRGLAPEPLLRLSVTIAPPGGPRREVVLDVHERSVVVRESGASEPECVVREIERLFIVDRQPPNGSFFTWYGVFARRAGRGDQLILETPDEAVARFVEQAIEHRLDLDDEPVHGELRATR